MSTIQVNCSDQVLSFASTPVISSGDIGADKVKFTFSNHWDGYAKICTFYQQKGNYFYGMIDDNDEVIIPPFVMSIQGNLHFGVTGFKNSITRTSNILTYNIVEGPVTEANPEEGADLINVIMQNVEEMREACDSNIEEMREVYDSVVDNLAYLRVKDENEFNYDITTTRINIGTYEGDGKLTQNIYLGYKPKAVVVYAANGRQGEHQGSSLSDIRIFGGLALYGCPCGESAGEKAIEIINTGFTVCYRDDDRYNYEISTNTKNEIYYYIAIGEVTE